MTVTAHQVLGEKGMYRAEHRPGCVAAAESLGPAPDAPQCLERRAGCTELIRQSHKSIHRFRKPAATGRRAAGHGATTAEGVRSAGNRLDASLRTHYFGFRLALGHDEQGMSSADSGDRAADRYGQRRRRVNGPRGSFDESFQTQGVSGSMTFCFFTVEALPPTARKAESNASGF